MASSHHLGGCTGAVAENFLRIDLRLDHVGVDVHVQPRVLAQLEERPDVVLGQPQVPAREKGSEWQVASRWHLSLLTRAYL